MHRRSDSANLHLLDESPTTSWETCINSQHIMDTQSFYGYLHNGFSVLCCCIVDGILPQSLVSHFDVTREVSELTCPSFQEVQQLSAVQTSIRFIPDLLAGMALSICVGLVLHKVSAYYIVLATSFVSAASPILMALINPRWPYWYVSFWAVVLSSVAGDGLFFLHLSFLHIAGHLT